MTRLRNHMLQMGTFISGLAAQHYFSKVLDHKENIANMKKIDNLEQKLDNITNINESMISKIDSFKGVSVPEEKLSLLNRNLNLWEDKFNDFKALCNKTDQLKTFEEKLECYLEAFKKAEECEKHQQIVKDIITRIGESSDNSNTLLPNFNLDFLYDYLNSLTLLEESAFVHILILLVITGLLFNILSAVLGNEIIEFFNLEQKYPKLAGILRLRLKFQKYYLILNFSLIFLIILATILLNLIVLY